VAPKTGLGVFSLCKSVLVLCRDRNAVDCAVFAATVCKPSLAHCNGLSIPLQVDREEVEGLIPVIFQCRTFESVQIHSHSCSVIMFVLNSVLLIALFLVSVAVFAAVLHFCPVSCMSLHCLMNIMYAWNVIFSLQCFDNVGWVTGRASGL